MGTNPAHKIRDFHFLCNRNFNPRPKHFFLLKISSRNFHFHFFCYASQHSVQLIDSQYPTFFFPIQTLLKIHFDFFFGHPKLWTSHFPSLKLKKREFFFLSNLPFPTLAFFFLSRDLAFFFLGHLDFFMLSPISHFIFFSISKKTLRKLIRKQSWSLSFEIVITTLSYYKT